MRLEAIICASGPPMREERLAVICGGFFLQEGLPTAVPIPQHGTEPFLVRHGQGRCDFLQFNRCGQLGVVGQQLADALQLVELTQLVRCARQHFLQARKAVAHNGFNF